MKLLGSCLFLVALLSPDNPLLANEAEESKRLLMDSKRCLAAFECEYFAAIAEKPELAGKLFLVGYESGRRFLGGAAKGKLLPHDRKEVAIAFGFVAGGPSHDFILGRLYEKMGEDLDRALKGQPRDSWKLIASDELRRRNAEMIIEAFQPDPSLDDGKDAAWNRYVEGLRTLNEELRTNESKAKPAD